MYVCFKILLNTLKDANEFVDLCEGFEEDVNYKYGRFIIDAASLMGILSCDLNKPANVEILTKDPDVIKEFEKSIEKWIVEE